MLSFPKFSVTLCLLVCLAAADAQTVAVEKVRSDFKLLLQRPAVDPMATMVAIATDSVLTEKGYFYSEASEKVPVLVYKPLGSEGKRLPVVICLHGTGGSKDNGEIRDLLMRLSRAGFMAVSIDARFHGERRTAADRNNSYTAAITNAWHNTDAAHQTHPFFLDTVYDLWKLVDYLGGRADVDAARIGMMGISMGGIETWMAASVDTRIKVAVPVIAAQSFQWSLENNRWQGRAGTIGATHRVVAHDLGDSTPNSTNVKALWDKILPGITNEFDCPSMIRLFAPRPLLLLNTEKDQNCPLPGAQLAFAAATQAYQAKNAADKFQFDVQPNQPHTFTARHRDMMVDFFKKWL